MVFERSVEAVAISSVQSIRPSNRHRRSQDHEGARTSVHRVQGARLCKGSDQGASRPHLLRQANGKPTSCRLIADDPILAHKVKGASDTRGKVHGCPAQRARENNEAYAFRR